MRIYKTLQPNERTEFNAQGQFIYLNTASAAIEVQVNGQLPVTLAQYDQLQTDAIHSLVVVNTSNQLNPIVLEIGFGAFVPSNSGHQVIVGNWPAQMKVEQTKPLQIDNWPDSYRVTVNNWKAVQSVKQSGDWLLTQPSAMNSEEITIAGSAGSLAANAKRSKVIIKAAASNSGAVTIGKYPLDKGEVITLSTTAQIDVTGTDGDILYIIEDVYA
ncbi:hypothetical protein [Celerinatantimonas sp. YJH-8]|uniref:hypothetical protein n=1 Tax=Celerinatantimonas sp. YJH-8 TaxID=3228714 RepID=UPI0038CAAC27